MKTCKGWFKALLFLAFLSIVTTPQPVHAAGPWYVKTDGDDGNVCDAPGNACATINGALGKADPGDTIYVAAGTYTGTGDEVVLLNKDVTLSGGWDDTFASQDGNSTIDGGGTVRGMSVNSGITAVLDRFFIQNSSRGIYNYYGTLTLNNCTVRDNTAVGKGGGIDNYYGSLTLNNSTVSNNSPDGNGGGINSNHGSVTLNNSTISGNSAYMGGGVRLEYTNNLYMNNSTISGNTAFYGGGIYSSFTTVTLRNSIVADNTADNYPDCNGTIGTAGYNLVGDTTGCTFTPTTGDMTDTDPNLSQIIGSPGYHPLLSGSPAINAGNPAGCEDHLGNPLNADQRGAPRVGVCDMGAYEYTIPGPAASISTREGTPQHAPPLTAFSTTLAVEILDAIGSPVNSATITFTAPLSGASGTFTDSGTYTTTALSGEGGIASADVFTSNNQIGDYVVSAAVSGVADPVYFHLENIVWYVTLGGDDGNDCQSVGFPCATIPGVFAKTDFFDGDTILVAADTFTSTGTEVVRLTRDVILSGGWQGSFTMQDGTTYVDGEDTRRGMRVDGGVTATVGHFSFRNGYGGSGGGIITYGALDLNNCSISHNTAGNDGGGINNEYGTLTLNSSSVTANTANEDGGGIYNYKGTVILNNSTLSGNLAGRWGGGIRKYDGTVALNSSTVSGNRAMSSGGGIDGSVTLQNSILAGNEGGSSPDCNSTISSLGYNLVGDTSNCTLTPTTGDLTAVDPNMGQLIGASGTPMYHPLLTGSPAIDAGNPGGCIDDQSSLLSTDQRGASRVGRCDIGAYEFTTPGSAANLAAISGTPQSTPPYSAFEETLTVAVMDGIGSPVDDVIVTFTAPGNGASGTFADSGTFITTALSGESGIATPVNFMANGIMGSYTVSATVSGVPTNAEFYLTNGGGWYVSTGGSDSNDCQTTTTPCASVDGPLAKPGFSAGDTIQVASGTYSGTGDEVALLDKDARLLGGWNGTFTTQIGETILDGEGSRRGLTTNGGVSAIFERFTILNGSSSYRGGGIYNNGGDLTVRLSIISGNAASNDGGGIYNSQGGTLTLLDCTIDGNNVSGIYNRGLLTMNYCVVSNTIGTGIRTWGQAVLNNTTVSGSSG